MRGANSLQNSAGVPATPHPPASPISSTPTTASGLPATSPNLSRPPDSPRSSGSADESPLLELLGGFIKELRTAGLPVSLTENLDAIEAVKHTSLANREAFKYALAATLVKNHAHWQAFETTFEIYFSLRGVEYLPHSWQDEAGVDGAQADSFGMPPEFGPASQSGEADIEELKAMLYAALLNGDQALLATIARQAVQRFANMEPGRPVGGTYYLFRTLRQLDLDNLLEKLMSEPRETPLTPLEERLERDEFEIRIDKLRKEVEAEIRRRLVADRGVEAMSKTLRKPLPEDVDFMHATREEMESVRKAIVPLTRKLAARLSRKRRHGRKGPLDFRNTIRHSLSYGGVPAEPKFRYPHPSKPEIVVIADISGSVASFARFTLHLVYAISSHFTKVRSFAFIDGLDEVTEFFEESEEIAEAIHKVNTQADVVWVDGHSDYGHALQVFWEEYGKSCGPKTTVLVLGDARNNYHASGAWTLKELRKKARRLYWLNPEPNAYWDTGDSIISEYATHCDDVFEVRNLRQLERFVESLV